MLLLRDEGQRRRAMAQMQMTERLASIGTLAAGVAHEVNNPLSFIGSNLTFVREQLSQAAATLGPLHAQIDDSLADCLEGLERIRVIVKDLKSFSRATPDESVHTDVDVNKAVQFALRVGEGEVRKHALVKADLAPVPPRHRERGPARPNLHEPRAERGPGHPRGPGSRERESG